LSGFPTCTEREREKERVKEREKERERERERDGTEVVKADTSYADTHVAARRHTYSSQHVERESERARKREE
jgi:hypothetical protein